MEHFISKHFSSFLENNDFFSESQHGFRRGFSTTTQLLHMTNEILAILGRGGQVDIFFRFWESVRSGLTQKNDDAAKKHHMQRTNFALAWFVLDASKTICQHRCFEFIACLCTFGGSTGLGIRATSFSYLPKWPGLQICRVVPLFCRRLYCLLEHPICGWPIKLNRLFNMNTPLVYPVAYDSKHLEMRARGYYT